jgi:hypothetical protein
MMSSGKQRYYNFATVFLTTVELLCNIRAAIFSKNVFAGALLLGLSLKVKTMVEGQILTLDKIANIVNCCFASYRLGEKALIILVDFKLIEPREFTVFVCTQCINFIHYISSTGLHLPTYNLKYNRH